MISLNNEKGYVAVSLCDQMQRTRSMRIPMEVLVDFLEIKPGEFLANHDGFCFVQDHAEHFEMLCKVLSAQHADDAFEITSIDIRGFENKYGFVFNRFPSAKIGDRFRTKAGR